ncbi:MAG: hypothetical protein ACRDOU_20450 [Streptosporangiaceae bacterium]
MRLTSTHFTSHKLAQLLDLAQDRTWNAPSFRVLEKLGFERDHISADDDGELMWLTRSLP